MNFYSSLQLGRPAGAVLVEWDRLALVRNIEVRVYKFSLEIWIEILTRICSCNNHIQFLIVGPH